MLHGGFATREAGQGEQLRRTWRGQPHLRKRKRAPRARFESSRSVQPRPARTSAFPDFRLADAARSALFLVGCGGHCSAARWRSAAQLGTARASPPKSPPGFRIKQHNSTAQRLHLRGFAESHGGFRGEIKTYQAPDLETSRAPAPPISAGAARKPSPPPATPQWNKVVSPRRIEVAPGHVL